MTEEDSGIITLKIYYRCPTCDKEISKEDVCAISGSSFLFCKKCKQPVIHFYKSEENK